MGIDIPTRITFSNDLVFPVTISPSGTGFGVIEVQVDLTYTAYTMAAYVAGIDLGSNVLPSTAQLIYSDNMSMNNVGCAYIVFKTEPMHGLDSKSFKVTIGISSGGSAGYPFDGDWAMKNMSKWISVKARLTWLAKLGF